MAAKVGVERTTLRLKAIDSNKAPPCPTMYIHVYSYTTYTTTWTDIETEYQATALKHCLDIAY